MELNSPRPSLLKIEYGIKLTLKKRSHKIPINANIPNQTRDSEAIGVLTLSRKLVLSNITTLFSQIYGLMLIKFPLSREDFFQKFSIQCI